MIHTRDNKPFSSGPEHLTPAKRCQIKSYRMLNLKIWEKQERHYIFSQLLLRYLRTSIHQHYTTYRLHIDMTREKQISATVSLTSYVPDLYRIDNINIRLSYLKLRTNFTKTLTMEHKGKTFVSVLIIISFFFSFIFCFDSPNIFTNIMLIGADILFWGGLLWLLWWEGGKNNSSN